MCVCARTRTHSEIRGQPEGMCFSFHNTGAMAQTQMFRLCNKHFSASHTVCTVPLCFRVYTRFVASNCCKYFMCAPLHGVSVPYLRKALGVLLCLTIPRNTPTNYLVRSSLQTCHVLFWLTCSLTPSPTQGHFLYFPYILQSVQLLSFLLHLL